MCCIVIRSLQVRLTRKRRVNNEQHPNHNTTNQLPRAVTAHTERCLLNPKRNSLTRTEAQEQPQLVHKSSQKRTPIPSGPLKARNSISASQTTPEADESCSVPLVQKVIIRTIGPSQTSCGRLQVRRRNLSLSIAKVAFMFHCLKHIFALDCSTQSAGETTRSFARRSSQVPPSIP